MQSTLIIRGELSNPPSCPLCFRFLTLLSHERLQLNNLIAVDKEFIDIYYKFLRAKGLLDYIDAIVTPEEETGVRLDIEPNYPISVIIDRVDWPSLNSTIGQIDYLRRI